MNLSQVVKNTTDSFNLGKVHFTIIPDENSLQLFDLTGQSVWNIWEQLDIWEIIENMF